MAYRRRHGISRASTFKEEVQHPHPDDHYNTTTDNSASSSSSSSASTASSSLAAQAIRASSAHRDSSLSSAYQESAFAFRDSDRQKSFPAARSTFHQSHQSPESSRKTDNPSMQRRLDAFTSSLSTIGGTIGKSFEEGLTMVENRTADIIQETRKLHIRKKGSNLDTRDQVSDANNPQQQVQMQTNPEMQLKASRDVAMAMAAKTKLLMRELKTVKADLAFAKERCNQLEEENRILRESHDKGDRPEDDDLIRLQLETLLAEKARLANENSIYARENRFLREIVEYHQLTMQDVVYLDEGIEEVTEVYPIAVPSETGTSSTLLGPPLPPVSISSEVKAISTPLTSQPVAAAAPPVTTAVPKDAAVSSSSSSPASAPHI